MTGHVLIVDDDEVYRKLMLSYFARIGLDASAARSGEEALQMLNGDSIPFDLILLDIAMPYQNGFELAKIVRADARWAQLPIVAVTARKGMDVDDEAKAAGIDRIITKPPEPSIIRALCVDLGLVESPQG